MEKRVFGRTGMQLSVLGFGCGAVGGLMVRGDALDQERTVARAITAGVNYFDTAVQYGNGEFEKDLGRVLHNLKASDVVVGTKVRLLSAEFGRIEAAVATSLEGSLARLRRDCVDIFHLHNAITEAGGEEALSVQQVVDDIVPAFERLRHQGKARFLGLTAIGDTMAIHQVIDARVFDSAKFPDQLGGREPIVHRTDLGPEGIYYRASIGPFVSMKAAAGVCSSLKAAGESCLVEKN